MAQSEHAPIAEPKTGRGCASPGCSPHVTAERMAKLWKFSLWKKKNPTDGDGKKVKKESDSNWGLTRGLTLDCEKICSPANMCFLSSSGLQSVHRQNLTRLAYNTMQPPICSAFITALRTELPGPISWCFYFGQYSQLVSLFAKTLFKPAMPTASLGNPMANILHHKLC